MLFNLLHAYFSNPPQDGVHGQSTGQIMVLGPGIASLVFWALKSLHCPRFLGPKIAFYWELLYKNLPMGAVVDLGPVIALAVARAITGPKTGSGCRATPFKYPK